MKLNFFYPCFRFFFLLYFWLFRKMKLKIFWEKKNRVEIFFLSFTQTEGKNNATSVRVSFGEKDPQMNVRRYTFCGREERKKKDDDVERKERENADNTKFSQVEERKQKKKGENFPFTSGGIREEEPFEKR